MANNFESNNFIQVYEKDGKEVGFRTEESVRVTNHFSRKEFVILEIDGTEIAVSASDLKRAIENAQNAHKY